MSLMSETSIPTTEEEVAEFLKETEHLKELQHQLKQMKDAKAFGLPYQNLKQRGVTTMYALILTICTTTVSLLGISSTECVTTSPASYANHSLCQYAGTSFVNVISSSNVTVTFTCEK